MNFHKNVVIKRLESNILSDTVFKVLLLGDTGVGKTALSNRINNEVFEEKISSTITSEYKSLSFLVDTKKLLIHLWDTPGLSVFRTFNKIYFRGANIVLLLFDYSSEDSFSELDKWMIEIEENLSNVPIFLVGSKTDLKPCSVSNEAVDEFMKKNEIKYIADVSSKTGEGCEELMNTLLLLLYESLLNPDTPYIRQPSEVLTREKSFSPKVKSSCSC